MSAAGQAPRSFLLVLGERAGLAWVLENDRMAFTAERSRLAADLQPGDRLFLYTSRGCFHNPTRDRGRVIGEAQALETLTERQQPVQLAGREFSHDLPIELRTLAPLGAGIDLAAIAAQLQTFHGKAGWAFYLRKPLVLLGDQDAERLRRLLKTVAGGDTEEARDRYVAFARRQLRPAHSA